MLKELLIWTTIEIVIGLAALAFVRSERFRFTKES